MRFDKSAGRKTAALAVIAIVGVVSPAALGSAAAARVLNVRDEGKLRFITSSGSEIIDEGPATGTVPGKVKVHFIYNGNPTVFASFTIYGHAGIHQRQGERQY